MLGTQQQISDGNQPIPVAQLTPDLEPNIASNMLSSRESTRTIMALTKTESNQLECLKNNSLQGIPRFVTNRDLQRKTGTLSQPASLGKVSSLRSQKKPRLSAHRYQSRLRVQLRTIQPDLQGADSRDQQQQHTGNQQAIDCHGCIQENTLQQRREHRSEKVLKCILAK